MKYLLISDSNYNIVNLLYKIIPQFIYKEWQIMLGKWHVELVTLYCGFQLALSKTIRIELVTLNIMFSGVRALKRLLGDVK